MARIDRSLGVKPYSTKDTAKTLCVRELYAKRAKNKRRNERIAQVLSYACVLAIGAVILYRAWQFIGG